jgi:hypothetical protein
VLTTGPITIGGGAARSLYVTGLNSNQTVKFGGVVESQRSIAGQAQLSVVVVAPSEPSVDVYLLTPGQPLVDADPTLKAASLLQNGSVNLTPGSYDVVVTRAASTVELFGPERISVDAGGVYTAVLLDAAGGGSPLQLQVTQEALP